jgi:glycosyltransferase involved in cell wall biosynthesis
VVHRPFFSIVLATYNRGPHIRPTIESALLQQCADFELLVVGDGCSDETAAAVRSFPDSRITWTSLEPNSGSQSAPNNEGLRRARGRWIAYLGHDDVWAPDHLSRLRETIEGDPALDFAISGCVYHGPQGSDVYYVTGLFETSDAARSHFFPPSSIAHRSYVPDAIGGWREPRSVPAPVDSDFLLRAAHAGLRFGSTCRITVHKFAAGHRYLSYLRPSSEEQRAMLALLEGHDGEWIDEVVVQAKRAGLFMGARYPDFASFAEGWFFTHNRRSKGLERPALRPLTDRTVIEQADDPRALDWHELEQGDRPFRWSGPNPRPRILLPFTGGEALVTIDGAWVPRQHRSLGDVSVFVEDEKVEPVVEPSSHGLSRLVFSLRLKPADYTVLSLHTPAMFRPNELLGWEEDRRKVGMKVADIVLEPI